MEKRDTKKRVAFKPNILDDGGRRRRHVSFDANNGNEVAKVWTSRNPRPSKEFRINEAFTIEEEPKR